MRPPTIHIEKSICAPGTSSSTKWNGSSHRMSIARPANVYATRSDTPNARKIGTMPTAINEHPSRNGIACAELRPLSASSAPSAIVMAAHDPAAVPALVAADPAGRARP